MPKTTVMLTVEVSVPIPVEVEWELKDGMTLEEAEDMVADMTCGVFDNVKDDDMYVTIVGIGSDFNSDWYTLEVDYSSFDLSDFFKEEKSGEGIDEDEQK